MLLRILLVVVMALAVSLGGCKKDEPKTVDDLTKVAEDAKKDVEKAADSDEVEDAKKDAEKAAEGLMK